MSRYLIAIVVVTVLAATAANAGTSPVLIIVDNTDPSNVTFNATGEAAAVVDDSASIVGGISLLDLFSGAGFNTNGSLTIGGDLSPSGNAGAYNRILNDFGALGTTGLNFWASGVGGGQAFNTSDPAFSGMTSGIDFGTASFNVSGDIVIGDTAGIPGSGAVLGSWALIPSPGAICLFALAGVSGSRRRRA